MFFLHKNGCLLILKAYWWLTAFKIQINYCNYMHNSESQKYTDTIWAIFPLISNYALETSPVYVIA